MTTFYRGPTVWITHDRFEVHGHVQEMYPIRELSRAYVVLPAHSHSWQPHELWAVYRGRPVLLFQSTDKRVFGQVRRALQRAIECWET